MIPQSEIVYDDLRVSKRWDLVPIQRNYEANSLLLQQATLNPHCVQFLGIDGFIVKHKKLLESIYITL